MTADFLCQALIAAIAGAVFFRLGVQALTKSKEAGDE